MKKLTFTLILFLSLAVARAQEVVDYGITINVSGLRQHFVKVTSENCADVLKDIMEQDGRESHQEVVYNPEDNTLTVNSELLNSYYYDEAAYTFSVIVAPSNKSLSIECPSPDMDGFHHVNSISAPESDISLFMDRSSEDGDNCTVIARSLTLKKGYYTFYPHSCITAQKLVLEPGSKALAGGAQCPPPGIDSLIVNDAYLYISTADYEGTRPGGYFDNRYVELNGSTIATPGYAYDSSQHLIDFKETSHTGIDDIYIMPEGDINEDVQVDVTDVSMVIDMILGKDRQAPMRRMIASDLNSDGQIDVSDVSALIDMVLGKNE